MATSAVASSAGEIASPSTLAVFKFMISSYLVGACTGRLAGFSKRRPITPSLGHQRTMGGSIVVRPARPNSAYPRTLPSLIELFLGGPCGRYFVPREIKTANDEHGYYYSCHHSIPQ